jgi:hypothetical protein
MDAQQDTFAFGSQQQAHRGSGQDFARVPHTDSEQSADEASEADRRRRRLAGMANWGKSGRFPTPSSDTTSSKTNNVDY